MNKMNDIGNRNPWTGAPLPPLPQVGGRDNWVLALEEEGELYHVYNDDAGPFALAFDVVVNRDGSIEIGVDRHADGYINPDSFDVDAARIGVWVDDMRAVVAWARATFMPDPAARHA